MAENADSFDTVTPLGTPLQSPMAESVDKIDNFMNFSVFSVFRGLSNGVCFLGFAGASLDFQVSGAHVFTQKFSENTTFLTLLDTILMNFREFKEN